MNQLPYNNQLNTTSFSKIIEPQNLHNSYKIFWFKAIVNNIEQSKYQINFKDIVISMLEESFDLIFLHRLRFGRDDVIPGIILSSKATDKNAFLEILYSDKTEETLKALTNYVPYRLLTPFYKDMLKNKKDSVKNKMILEFINSDPLALYKINSTQQSIEINPIWVTYIKDNISIIKAWIDLKLINFLQRRNPSVPNIPFKVNPLKNRNLNRAKKLWEKAIDFKPALNYDLFLDIKFNTHTIQKFGTLSIDHFLPWSFVAHDELWNLIPIHSYINSRKSNNLPDKKFIPKYIEMQYDFFSTIRKIARPEDIEEYQILINNSGFEIDDLELKYFYNIFFENTISLYNIAKNNGFSVWNEFNL